MYYSVVMGSLGFYLVAFIYASLVTTKMAAGQSGSGDVGVTSPSSSTGGFNFSLSPLSPYLSTPPSCYNSEFSNFILRFFLAAVTSRPPGGLRISNY